MNRRKLFYTLVLLSIQISCFASDMHYDVCRETFLEVDKIFMNVDLDSKKEVEFGNEKIKDLFSKFLEDNPYTDGEVCTKFKDSIQTILNNYENPDVSCFIAMYFEFEVIPDSATKEYEKELIKCPWYKTISK